MLLIRLCAALIFFHAAAAICAGQSAGPAKADAASRASATYQQGLSALRQGDLAFARAAFERVLRLVPQSPEGHNSLGWVLLAQNEVDSAIAHFRAALRWKPEFVQAHVNLANALVRKGDLPAALREAREAARVAADDSEARRTVARGLEFSGDCAAVRLSECAEQSGFAAAAQRRCRGSGHCISSGHKISSR